MHAVLNTIWRNLIACYYRLTTLVSQGRSAHLHGNGGIGRESATKFGRTEA